MRDRGFQKKGVRVRALFSLPSSDFLSFFHFHFLLSRFSNFPLPPFFSPLPPPPPHDEKKLHPPPLLLLLLLLLPSSSSAGKKLYWNEYGVGGGTTQDGKSKALTAQQAAATPFFGMGGRYNRSRDPWTLFDQQTPNPVRDYLRYFYGQTLNYASSRVRVFAARRPPPPGRPGDLGRGRGGGEREEGGRNRCSHLFSSLPFSPPPLLQKKKKKTPGPLRGLRVPRRRHLHLERRLVGHPGHLPGEHRRGRR